MNLYLNGSSTPDPEPEKTPAPYIPAEEEIIADGSAGAFEATEVVSEEDLHPYRSNRQKEGKDYY